MPGTACNYSYQLLTMENIFHSESKTNQADKWHNKNNRKANGLVQKILRQDMIKLLCKLDIQTASCIQTNRAKLRKVQTNDLKQILQEMGTVTNGENAKLQEWLLKRCPADINNKWDTNRASDILKMMTMYGTKELGLVSLLALWNRISI